MTHREIAEKRIDLLELQLLLSPFLHQKECGLVMALANEARRLAGTAEKLHCALQTPTPIVTYLNGK